MDARDFTIVLDLGGIIEHANMLHRGANKGGHAMKQAREKLLLAAMRAEDDAVVYLHKFDPAVALETACSVEQTLAIT